MDGILMSGGRMTSSMVAMVAAQMTSKRSLIGQSSFCTIQLYKIKACLPSVDSYVRIYYRENINCIGVIGFV